MSGFLERVIEDWLTKTDERGYQLPFVSALARSGHRIKYVSSHSTLEHGKDVISVSPEKLVHAYQLKTGNINLAAWRAIRGEVLEAATVPVEIPGMSRKVADRATLVVTGRLSDSVRNQIALINEDQHSRGLTEIDTIELDELVADFAAVFEGFFPAALQPLNELVGLYLQEGRGPQDKVSLFRVLAGIAGESQTKTVTSRSLANLVVAAEFCASPFRRAGNHISVIDTWVIAACQILLIAARNKLVPGRFAQSLSLCRQAVKEAGDALLDELLERDDFLEGDSIVDPAFVGVRKSVVLGYASAVLNSRRVAGGDVREQSERLLDLLSREPGLEVWGESAWNLRLNVALAIRHSPLGAHISELIMEKWLEFACPERAPWPKDPYWSVEDATSLNRQRQEVARGQIERARFSYTANAAVSFLARRMRRNAIKQAWPNLSRYDLARVVPAEDWMAFEWEVREGSVELCVLPHQGSWKRLIEQAFRERSKLFTEENSWLLPYFLCTYPHRTAPQLAGELDFRTSPAEFQHEWCS